MSSRSSDVRDNEGGRLGGARADFVASLGRKVNDARDVLAALEDDPSSKRRARRAAPQAPRARRPGRDCSASTRWRARSRRRSPCSTAGPNAGSLREQDVAFVAQALDDLPALAWGEAPPRDGRRRRREDESRADARAPMPVAALVVGGESLADALTDDGGLGAHAVRVRAHRGRADRARSGARLRARRRARRRGRAASAGARRGAARRSADRAGAHRRRRHVPRRPTSRRASSRSASRRRSPSRSRPEAPPPRRATRSLDAREGRTMRITLGEPTLEQLGDRLAEELKRALVDSVDAPARSCRVPLGEGTEVLGAMWGAIARVQEIVAAEDGRRGSLRRRRARGGHRARAVAPSRRAGRRPRRGRAGAARRPTCASTGGASSSPTTIPASPGSSPTCSARPAARCTRRSTAPTRARARVPRPARARRQRHPDAGARRLRALPRAPARRRAARHARHPALVEGGPAPARARARRERRRVPAQGERLARDPGARPRGAPAARARSRRGSAATARCAGASTSSTARLLLELVGVVRRDARVAVRDASFLYEIEIRGGAPRKATRTASDGGYQRGERALASLLGVGAGRFVVSPQQRAHPRRARRHARRAARAADRRRARRARRDDGRSHDERRADRARRRGARGVRCGPRRTRRARS